MLPQFQSNNQKEAGVTCLRRDRRLQSYTGTNFMGKEQKSNKEAKKPAGMTPKEKKAAKKAKKNERGRIGE